MKIKQDTVVVVTGGTAGVGRAVARQFAGAGAAVAVLARDPERLEATSRELEEAGGRALAIATDVADAAQVVSCRLAILDACRGGFWRLVRTPVSEACRATLEKPACCAHAGRATAGNSSC